MTLRKFVPLILLLILVGVGAAYVLHFTTKGSVEIFDSGLEISPESFSVDIAKGGHYVKEITIRNTGEEKEIYFEDVVEGADSKAIDVTYHTTDGATISSSKKLTVPAGTSDSPAEVIVNVHIDVDEDAPEGEYTVYIQARS